MFRGNLRKWEKTGGRTAILGGTKVIFGPWNFEGCELKSLFVYNQGANALDRGVVEVSADGNVWGTLDATTFVTLGSDVLGRGMYTNTIKWWRIGVAVTGGTGTFAYWWGF